MTARQTGQRISDISGQYRYSRRTPARRQAKMSGREKRRLFQLVTCGVIFVSLVAVKLLLPGKMEGIRSSISSLMNQNMDVTEVFSAVGKAFSGKEDVKDSLNDVYEAVFHPVEGEALETSARVSPKFGEPSPLTAMRQFANGTADCDVWVSTSKVRDVVTSGTTKKVTVASSTKSGSQSSSHTSTSTATAQKSGNSRTSNLSFVLYSGNNLPKNVSLGQVVLGFKYCTPVNGTLSSKFGYREHPIEGEEKFHYGIDIAATSGTAVDCFADGSVTAVGKSTSYGNYLTVSHQGGYSTLYAHCKKVVVSSGKKVKKGQKIAEVGETGLATGPHLHFELHKGNTYLDPIYYVSVKRV